MKQFVISIPTERIESLILLIRGEKVILDRKLALLYGVTTSRLIEAVSRNKDRFPDDFFFRLTDEEVKELNRLYQETSKKVNQRKML